MDFIRTYAKELFALLVPVMTTVISRLTRSRVRITYATPHVYTFLVQEPRRDAQGNVISPTQTVHTRSFWFRNDGKAIAHNVELVFNWKPLCLNVWPTRHYDVNVEPDNRYILKFDTLAPGEIFGCELLNVNNALPDLITCRSDEGVGKLVTMYPQRTFPQWLARTAGVLVFVGLAAAVYLLIALLQWLVLKTPIVL